ncbi:MAG: hypothetical protein ACK448_03460 [Bacteroidota bacterium]
MKTNHWYYWITGTLFAVLGLLMVVLDSTLPIIPIQLAMAMDNYFGWVLFAWGLFRGVNGYWLYKKSLRNQSIEAEAATDV